MYVIDATPSWPSEEYHIELLSAASTLEFSLNPLLLRWNSARMLDYQLVCARACLAPFNPTSIFYIYLVVVRSIWVCLEELLVAAASSKIKSSPKQSSFWFRF